MDQNYPPSHPQFWISLGIAILLVMLAAICSGMTVGYLSIDEMQLEIKLVQGTDEEKRQAKVILPLIRNHHMLLCTLLVVNAFCMESLPIFFDQIVPSAFAIVISVIFIVFGGEILPQAICTGANQLKIAEKLTPLIKTIMFLMYPLTYPLATTLDKLFGAHSTLRFQKNELKALIELHEITDYTHDKRGGFTQPEIEMITSTIDLREKSVVSAMVPLKQIVMVNAQTHYSMDTRERISNSNYSYIGVYESEKCNIIGTIKTKQLIESSTDKFNGKRFGSLNIMRPSLIVAADTSLIEMLMIFKTKRTKVAFIEERVKDSKDSLLRSASFQVIEGRRLHKIIGLISLKDVFEELVKKELQDQDNHVPYYSVHVVSREKPKQEEECTEK